MIFSLLLLFLSAVCGGIIIYLIPHTEKVFKLSLTFAGAYLFSITVIHIIPEMYARADGNINIGLFMLIGYFLQHILEYFSSGIEHGHLHQKDRGHSHSGTVLFSVLIALSIHAFLEGGMLANPTVIHSSHQNYTLLAGIVLHKIPAAYALMSLVTCKSEKLRTSLIVLLLFALASPMGLLAAHFSHTNQILQEQTELILFSIVSGSFLQISTTIVFESSPQHKFDLWRFGVAILAAITAIASELI